MAAAGHLKAQEGESRLTGNRRDQPPLTTACPVRSDIAVTFAALFCVLLCQDIGSPTAVMFVLSCRVVEGGHQETEGWFPPAPRAGLTVPVGAPSCAQRRTFVPAAHTQPPARPVLQLLALGGGVGWGENDLLPEFSLFLPF